MRIGLLGFSFTDENKGCEALTYAMLAILAERFPDGCDISVFSSSPTLGNIPAAFPQFRYSWHDVGIRDLGKRLRADFDACDFLFDITYGDGFSDIYFVKSAYKNALVKCMAGRSKARFILAPQTYGPFKHKSLERLAGAAIRSADAVFARDRLSGAYACRISDKKVNIVTDLAFALPCKRQEKSGDKIGLNVSGLLWRGGFSASNQFGLLTDYREYCRSLVEAILKQTGYQVHLIPHVTTSFDSDTPGLDNDVQAVNALKELFAGEDRVVVAPAFQTPIEAKRYISGMDIFTGARMHATIAAFSTDVVTIPFAYSPKFKGLYENLGYRHLIDGRQLGTEEAVQKTMEMVEDRARLAADQQGAMGWIQKQLDQFGIALNDLFNQVEAR